MNLDQDRFYEAVFFIVSNSYLSPFNFPNNKTLDLAPTEYGKVEQIISIWHDDSMQQVIAESFSNWLEQFANELEAGKYTLYEEDDGLVIIDDV